MMNLEAKIDTEQKNKVYNGPLKEMRKNKNELYDNKGEATGDEEDVPLSPILKQWRTMEN